MLVHIMNFPLESLILYKKLQPNPLGSFEDLRIHADRQRVGTFVLFIYFLLTMLYTIPIIFHPLSGSRGISDIPPRHPLLPI
jgi:hypothetical protein